MRLYQSENRSVSVHHRQAASADDRAERDHEFQEPDHAGSGLCEHDRAGPVPQCRLHHRRGGRVTGTRHDVAGPEPVDDAAAQADLVDSVDVHADAGRTAVLPGGTRRPAGGGVQLK